MKKQLKRSASGCLILLAVALLFNNMTSNREYPTNSRFTRLIRKTKSRYLRHSGE